jgi:hypothetical protein
MIKMGKLFGLMQAEFVATSNFAVREEPEYFSGTALGYGLDDGGSSPDSGWEFFSSPPYPDLLWGPLSLSNG